MSKHNWTILTAYLTVMALFLAGCTASEEPTLTPVPLTVTPLVTASPTVPATAATPETADACNLTAQSEVTLYERPSLEAGIFGVLSSGESIVPTIQSAEGWLGFVPGVAQAANVGVFRNRWLPPDADVSIGGDCSALPVAPPLSPTACYFMAFSDTAVLAEPDPASALVATIPGQGYAAVIGQADNGWFELDLQDSALQQPGTAWLDPDLGNFNGTCEIIFG